MARLIPFRLGGRAGGLRARRFPVDRSSNPHGSPFLRLEAQKGRFANPQLQGPAMPTKSPIEVSPREIEALLLFRSLYPSTQARTLRTLRRLQPVQPDNAPKFKEAIQ